jgi:hypothetical protein
MGSSVSVFLPPPGVEVLLEVSKKHDTRYVDVCSESAPVGKLHWKDRYEHEHPNELANRRTKQRCSNNREYDKSAPLQVWFF